MRKVEVIIYRDDETDVTVLVDGVPLTEGVAIVVVDPGKGYMRADWEESQRYYAQADNAYSAAAKAAIDQAYIRGAETEWVEP